MVHERSRTGPAGPSPTPTLPSAAVPALAPVRQPDRDAFDLSYALGRARDWLLGPAPLAANVALALFTGLGVALWQLSRDPESFGLPWWLVVWAVIVVIHAVVALLWASMRGWRTTRRPAPVYYAQIPPEQRTRRRQADPAPVRPDPAPAAPASWQGVLAPVTPFPTLRGSDGPVRGRETGPLPPARADGSAGVPPVASPALQSARDILASEQPFWRRRRRQRTVDPVVPGGSLPDPAPLPVPPADESSWLAPYPVSPPVTRAAGTDPARAGTRPETPGSHLPANGTSARASSAAVEDDQLPSLAAMLRSSNLTTMSEAPFNAGNGTPRTLGSGRPERAPDLQPVATGLPGSTSALFAAFGIEGDGAPEVVPTRDGALAPPPPPDDGSAVTETLPASSDRATPRPAPAWGPVGPNGPHPAGPVSPVEPASTSISRAPTRIDRPR